MIIENIEKNNTLQIVVFIIGCVGLVSLIIFDKLYWGDSVFKEGWPDSSLSHLMRSIILFIFVLAVFWSLIGSNRPKLILSDNNGVHEDGPVEYLSALFLFFSCIIIATSYSKSRNISNIPKFIKLSLVLLSSLFFLIAMEEISWFQRVLEIETPKAFGGNIQHEMNLHNFATNFIENAYYFSTFLFLVVLPFIRLLFPFMLGNNYFRVFVARPFIGVIGSIAYAYNFDMWNGIFTQITFFGSVVILFAFAMLSSNRKDRYIISFTIILVVSTQVLFLINGEKFARIWEVTEYKELFIPLALFVYSLDVFAHINRVCFPEKS